MRAEIIPVQLHQFIVMQSLPFSLLAKESFHSFQVSGAKMYSLRSYWIMTYGNIKSDI